MAMHSPSIVVPANAGTHNHRTEFWPLASTKKATHTLLTNDLHGVWVPAFAGTTGVRER
jgi:hypothetical protein